jgi:hypothetical protein
MIMASSPVEERNFYLTLSILEGQKLAHAAGFSVPSPDVQEHEIIDTMQKWFILSNTGVLHHLKECASWMITVLRENNDFDEVTLKATENIITSFAVATIAHLVDQDIISIDEALTPDPAMTKTMESLVEMMLSAALDDLDYDEDDYEEEDEEDEQ